MLVCRESIQAPVFVVTIETIIFFYENEILTNQNQELVNAIV